MFRGKDFDEVFERHNEEQRALDRKQTLEWKCLHDKYMILIMDSPDCDKKHIEDIYKKECIALTKKFVEELDKLNEKQFQELDI